MDHLTTAQIEEYVAQGHLKMADGVFQSLEAHLEDCESCLDRVLHVHRMHLGLLEGDRMNKTRHPGCPEETVLQELAAAISSPETAEATAQHASRCDFCGLLLNRYLKEFSDDLEAEDAALLKQLESSKPGWQKKFVRDVVGAGQARRERSFLGRFWPALATATAAIAVAATVVAPTLISSDSKKAQQLVLQASGERRTIETQLPSAPYAPFNPVPIVKGSSDGGDWNSEPAALVEAEGIVKRNADSHGQEPQWLQIKGEIDLLQGGQKGIDLAIESFEKALKLDTNNSAIKVGLATALYEKEIRSGRDHPVLARSIDLLVDVTKNSSQVPKPVLGAALFDLALAYEKSEMRDLAISTWQQYADFDKTSEWNKEAQRHLDDLRNHAPPPREQGYDQPAYFLAHSSDPAVLSDLEEFLDIALRTWLPTAIENPGSEAGKATVELAELLKAYHSDTWLDDLLHEAHTNDASAFKMLSHASTHDLNDLHYQGIKESRRATATFQTQQNPAGELRARYEEIYGLQRSLAADDCLQRIKELWPRVFASTYRWLQGQLALEKAACANLNLDFPAAARNINISRQIAQEFQFPELLLRIDGFEAGIQRWQENYDTAWIEAVNGLRLYWKGKCPPNGSATQNSRTLRNLCPYSPERIYQFYSVMQQCTRKMGLDHTSEALIGQDIEVLESSVPDDIVLRAMLYLRLANIWLRRGNQRVAEDWAGKAESLLKQIPTQEPTGQIYAALTRIELAEFELDTGNPESALLKIEPVREFLSGQDDIVRLDFYTIQGDIYQQINRVDDAISAYHLAIQIAESSAQEHAGRQNWILATGKVYRGLARALLRLGRDQEALSVWEWSLRRSIKGDGTSEEWAGNALAYPHLPSVPYPHIVFASFKDGLQVWIVRNRSVVSRWLPVKREELEQDVAEFKKECADSSRPVDKAQALHSKLLQPIMEDLPGSGILALEPDEPLWGMAFAALADSQGHYFDENYLLVYSPGILVDETLRQSSSLSGTQQMLMVDASQSANGDALPGHSIELNAVMRAFPRTRILGPPNISPEAVRMALSRSMGIHVTSHGIPDGTGTALAIGPDLFLRARDFHPQDLRRLELAVLSACSSGSAKNGVFDESNLVRSFLSGGVPNVIASGWEVDSRSTAQFMQSFYGQLRTGKTPAQALQYAQAEMRSINSHPYYWAAFSLAGRVN